VSSFYCFCKANQNSCTSCGYELKINKQEYENFIKPLIHDDKINFCIYLQLFEDNEISKKLIYILNINFKIWFIKIYIKFISILITLKNVKL